MPLDIMQGLLTKDEPDEKLMSTYQGWQRAREHFSRHRQRGIENWRQYLAHDNELGMGQWPERSVSYMLEQNRQLLTYNFILPTVDTIAGGIMHVPFDPEYYPINTKMSSITEAAKKAMYADKEVMDWPVAYFELVRAGLVHEGWIKMYVSDEYDPLGNIGLRSCLPGSVTPSPYWKSLLTKDCPRLWYESWHSVEEIKESACGEARERLEYEIKLQKRYGDEYGAHTGVVPYNTEDNRWGSHHRVIQEYSMITEKTQQDYVKLMDGEVYPIPRTIPKDRRLEWLNRWHPDWQPDGVWTEEESIKTCTVRSIAPSISDHVVLEDKPIELQIGRLPFFCWSACRVNGESHSIVDSIRDPQLNINYMLSLTAYKIQVEGGGGSQFVDPKAFESNEEYERYITNRNDPTENFRTRPGLLLEGKRPAVPTATSGYPGEVYKFLENMIDVVFPRVSKVPSVQRGMSDTSGDSGKLFEAKKIQSDQALYTIHYGLRLFWNEVYEAYFMAQPDVYGNERVPRTFVYNKGRESVTFNERVTLPDGRVAIKNDILELKRIRSKVIVSETSSSPTEKLENVQVMAKMLQTMGALDPATAQLISTKIAEYLPGINDEDRDALMHTGYAALKEKLAAIDAATTKHMVDKITLELQALSLQEQLEQKRAMMARQAQMGGMPMGGAAGQGGQPAPAGGGAPSPQAPSGGGTQADDRVNSLVQPSATPQKIGAGPEQVIPQSNLGA